FSVLFTRMGDTITAAFGKTDLLRSALDAALDPAVAGAPQNDAVMDLVWGPITERVTAQLPPGVDLGDPAVRADVVDQAAPAIREAIADGAAGSGDLATSLNGDTSFLTGADPRLTAPFLDGFASASVTVFWVSAAIVLVAFVLSFFLKAEPLREKSAVQERVEADRAAAHAAQELALEAQRAA